jgi:hypothetical protein
MPRANLRGLIGNLGETEVPEPGRLPPPTVKPDHVSADATPGVKVDTNPPEEHSSTAPAVAPSAPTTPDQEVQSDAHFTSFQRKETRLRADQQNVLTEHARRLNRAKGTGGQRITDNTLIRVAVDLLLARTDKLAGRDEAELRRSLGLKGVGR